MASRYLRYPVTKTGVYSNGKTGELEYWFVLGDRRAKIGACKTAMPQSVKDAWERETKRALRETISRKVAGDTRRTAARPVALVDDK